MTGISCPSRDLLSAYVDREANPSEERRVALHLADCGACRAQVRSFTRLKTAVRNQPLPAMPADLKQDLLKMAREADARVRRKAGGRFAALDRAWVASAEALAALWRRPAWSMAAAAALLAFAWGGRRLQGGGTPVPVDFVLAAHNQYARTMPLASTEKIMTELPVQISYAGSEDGKEAGADVY